MKRRKPLILLIFLFFFCIFSKTANAQTPKNIFVELKNDYTACSFKLSFTNPGVYTATLISPDNQTEQISAEFSKVDDLTMICNAAKCKAGTWSISITKMDSELPEEIGPVKVSVEATKEKESDLVENIKVGKDISGLRLFFVDDELNVIWSDKSCGNVTVQVINTATNEIIDNQTISDQSYTCKIAQNIKTITVSVVPTVSSKIDDAIQKFNLKVESKPKGIVTFEDVDETNKEYLEATLDLEEEYGCEVYVNDKKVITQGLMDIGTHILQIPLAADHNSINLFLVDTSGNKYSFHKTLLQDTICPVLSLHEEYDGIQTKENKITITGNLSDYDKFYCNDKEYSDISTDGQFDIVCDLHIGNNDIILKAVDKAGNEIIYEASILMKEKSSSPIGFIILILIAVLISFVLVIKKVTKKEKQSINEKQVDELEYVPDDEEFNTGDSECLNEMSLEEYEEIQKKDSKAYKTKMEWIKFSIFCIILILFLNFVVTICIIPTGSMEPTIAAGDIVLINDLAYVASKPQRGEIVVFKSSEKGIKMNKRIVGMPGDSISFKNGYVYINNQKLEEAYLKEEIETNSCKTFAVPLDCYFLLGDNRENSDDSRFWNEPFIKKSAIKGKVFFHFP